MPNDGRISIVVADEHPIFRDGLRLLLAAEPDLIVLGDAGNAADTNRLVSELAPDVLLLDLAMSRGSGMDVLRALSLEPTMVRVIILAATIKDGQMIEALELGARGVVLKESATSLLLKCIRTVVGGQYWVGREAVTSLVDGLRQARQQRHERAAGQFALTDRQLEIVHALVAGHTNREIADALGISEDTVKQHLSSIFDKCGVSSRVELAMFAVDHRLIER